MKIKMTQAARQRKIGVTRVRYVIDNTTREFRVAGTGETILWWVGTDTEGARIEIGAVTLFDWQGNEILLIIHLMPAAWRRTGR